MRFNRKIYNWDWRIQVVQLLPMALRHPLLKSLALALTSPVAVTYVALMQYKMWAEYELTITPQTCYLQKMLNDFFDYTARRIVIEDVIPGEQPALYLKSEGEEKGLITYLQGEAPAGYFFATTEELQSEGGYFIVKVPVILVYNRRFMEAKLNHYKLPTTTYNIIEV